MSELSVMRLPAGFDQSLRDMRHHLHRHPELGFQEVETSAFVAEQLRALGYDVVTGIAGTGLVASLRAGTGAGSVGLRADMDALPIREDTGLSYASRHDGCMHACGHDGHMTMLLGAARLLAAHPVFSGTVHLIFQPAEELGVDSGGQAMVKAGLFERFPCDRVYAMHNHVGAPQGRFMARVGPFMASDDRVFVTLRGEGGHAARPHLVRDPVVAAAACVMALQTVVSRNVDPQQAAVVSIGKLHAGQAVNVISDQAELGITVRSFDSDVRALLKSRIETLLHRTADGYGIQAEVRYVEGYPVLVNHPEATRLALSAAADLVGADQVHDDATPQMGSEDFAYMLQQRPGALIRLGNGLASDGAAPLHHPRYDFNDDNLVLGARFWHHLVTRCLPAG